MCLIAEDTRQLHFVGASRVSKYSPTETVQVPSLSLSLSLSPSLSLPLPLSPRSQVGSNNRKRDLTVELIDKCGPSLVVGRMADIYTLGQVVVERGIHLILFRCSPTKMYHYC